MGEILPHALIQALSLKSVFAVVTVTVPELSIAKLLVPEKLPPEQSSKVKVEQVPVDVA